MPIPTLILILILTLTLILILIPILILILTLTLIFTPVPAPNSQHPPYYFRVSVVGLPSVLVLQFTFQLEYSSTYTYFTHTPM